jgi:hypothetical protein
MGIMRKRLSKPVADLQRHFDSYIIDRTAGRNLIQYRIRGEDALAGHV